MVLPWRIELSTSPFHRTDTFASAKLAFVCWTISYYTFPEGAWLRERRAVALSGNKTRAQALPIELVMPV
jgi:hypothetical protein